eukprot:9351787-Pyramimonas_sp.AAC.1
MGVPDLAWMLLTACAGSVAESAGSVLGRLWRHCTSDRVGTHGNDILHSATASSVRAKGIGTGSASIKAEPAVSLRGPDAR